MKTEWDELQKSIEQAKIPDELKKILTETIKSLTKRGETVFSEIRERVLQEVTDVSFDWSKNWNIATALIQADENGDTGGFYKILSARNENVDEEYILGEPKFIEIIDNYFLDCSHEETVAYCSDEYGDEYPYQGEVNLKGKTTHFRYRLAYDLRYVNFERELFDVADIYQIKRPVIFSPYSRRAVKIQIPREFNAVSDYLKEHAGNLTPYCLENNDLANKLITGKRLEWNIRINSIQLPEYNVTDDNSDNSSFAPYGERNIYRYEFKNLNDSEFICPRNDELINLITAQITPPKADQKQMITLVAKKPLTEPCRSLRLIPTKTNISHNKFLNWGFNVFANFDIANKDRNFFKERLRTVGDIENVLYRLGMPQHGFNCKFSGVSDSEKKNVNVIKIYNRELAYGNFDIRREQVLYGNRRKLPFCYITFNGNAKFLNDYAAYVLSFLETRYPDFQWVGVK